MFTPNELRALLDRPDLSDEEALQVQDNLAWLARALIDDYLRDHAR